MTLLKVRGTHLEPQVRLSLEKLPLADAFHKRFGVEPEVAKKIVDDSVIDAMELLGSRYVTRMTEVVGHLTQLREAIHLVYEKILAGNIDDLDPAALRQKFDELHAATKELVDPKGWAEGEGQQVEPLPPVVEYPGARTGLEDKPSVAPKKGDPVHGKPGKTWDVQTKRRGDITLEIDPEGLYWKFPELEDGVVLHFPDYGYTVWKEPGTGAIVEELIVGPSVSDARGFTRGEDVIFSAAEMGDAYRKAGTQRAHGAGAPGLGFDAGYGIAHAIERINGWLENNGVEQWVRDLRDNAGLDVEYVWKTATLKRGQKLAHREYTISAIVDGKQHELYTFEVSVPQGRPNVDAPIDFDVVGITPEAELYGAPYTKKSLKARAAAKGKDKPPLERLEPPEVVSKALGRTKKPPKKTTLHPSYERTGRNLERLQGIVETLMATRGPDWSEAIDKLSEVTYRLDDKVKMSAPNPERLARIDAAITAFARKANRPTLPLADVEAFTAELQNILRGR